MSNDNFQTPALLPAFRYPSYSEIYFTRKKEIEERRKRELKILNDIQPWYEQCVIVLRKFPFTQETKFFIEGASLNWTIRLQETDSLKILEPLLRAFQDVLKLEKLYVPSTSSDSLQWYFNLTPEIGFYIKVIIPSKGLTDVKVLQIPTTYTYTRTEYKILNPFWD